MKTLVPFFALAAGLAATVPAPASAADVAVGLEARNGNLGGYLTLVDHTDRYYRRHRGRHCQSWRRVHRKLHRRFDGVRLRRRIYNRRGHKVYIAYGRTHRGRRVRIRYNACTHRVTRVRRLGRRHWRHHRRYCQNWRRAHRRLHRRFDDVELVRRTRNRRGHRVFIARARSERSGRRVRVRYNACTRRVTDVRRLGHHGHHRGHRRDHRRHRR